MGPAAAGDRRGRGGRGAGRARTSSASRSAPDDPSGTSWTSSNTRQTSSGASWPRASRTRCSGSRRSLCRSRAARMARTRCSASPSPGSHDDPGIDAAAGQPGWPEWLGRARWTFRSQRQRRRSSAGTEKRRPICSSRRARTSSSCRAGGGAGARRPPRGRASSRIRRATLRHRVGAARRPIADRPGEHRQEQATSHLQTSSFRSARSTTSDVDDLDAGDRHIVADERRLVLVDDAAGAACRRRVHRSCRSTCRPRRWRRVAASPSTRRPASADRCRRSPRRPVGGSRRPRWRAASAVPSSAAIPPWSGPVTVTSNESVAAAGADA